MFLLVLFCLILTIALVLSFVSNDILKRDQYIFLFLIVAFMMDAFYCKDILIFIAVALLIGSLSACLFYFLVFKHYGGIKGLLTLYNNAKESKVDMIVDCVVAVLSISIIKSELIMAIMLVTYLIYNRYMFYRRFSSII